MATNNALSLTPSIILQNAQRKILLEGHRKCFCWLDEWHGLTMEDVRKMEDETAEAISKVRMDCHNVLIHNLISS